jgi:hypothetical protein
MASADECGLGGEEVAEAEREVARRRGGCGSLASMALTPADGGCVSPLVSHADGGVRLAHGLHAWRASIWQDEDTPATAALLTLLLDAPDSPAALLDAGLAGEVAAWRDGLAHADGAGW